MKLSAKVAVVTGGTRGLGLEIARLLAGAGASVVIGSRSADAVQRAVAELSSAGVACGLACDVTRRDDVMSLREAALKRYGQIDIWVNNAGTSGVYGPVHRVPEDSFEATTRTIVFGTYYGTLAALDVMVPAGSGHLVNLLGRGDDSPAPNQVAYGAAKAWVRAFTLAVAEENKASGVIVHGFNPGLVRTDLLGRVETVGGFRERLLRLPAVVSVIGRTPAQAALPVLDLVTGERREYRGVTPARLLGQAAHFGLAKLRGRVPEPMAMEITDVPDRPSSVGEGGSGARAPSSC